MAEAHEGAGVARRRRAIVLALAVLAVALAVALTRHDVGVSTDGGAYLSSADGLRHGHGLTMAYRPNTEPVARPVRLGERVPLTAFPPLYPAVLATGSLATAADVLTVARWLGVLVLAATTALVAAATARRTGSAAWAAVAGLLVLAADIVALAGMALSDSLFILLVTGGLLTLDRYRRSGRTRDLVATAALVALAVGTRQVGLALTATALLAIAVRPVGWRRRWALALVAGAAALPLVVDTWRTRGGPGVAVAWHPVGPHDLRTLAGTVANWLVSVDVLGGVVGGAVVIVAVALVVTLCRRAGATETPSGTTGTNATTDPIAPALAPPSGGTLPATVLPALSVAFAAVYVLAVALADSVLGAGTIGFGSRILAPVHVVLALGGTVWVGRSLAGRRGPTLAAGAVLVTLAGIGLARSLVLIDRFDGSADKGATGAPARTSPTVAAVRALPAGTVVVTDRPSVLWLATRRPVVTLPPELVYATSEANSDRGDELAELADAIAGREAMLVLFDQEPTVVDLATGGALVTGAPRELADGTIVSLSAR